MRLVGSYFYVKQWTHLSVLVIRGDRYCYGLFCTVQCWMASFCLQDFDKTVQFVLRWTTLRITRKLMQNMGLNLVSLILRCEVS